MIENMSEGLDVHPTSLLCKTAITEGNIQLGAGCVVHPTATIKATNGPIIFGEDNLIEERATIENLSFSPLVIGNGNVFEVGCVVHASSIGNNNVLSVQCVVNSGVEISNGCTIGVRCQVSQKGIIPPKSVVFGENNEIRLAHDDPPHSTSQLEILRKIFPSYHHIFKKAK